MYTNTHFVGTSISKKVYIRMDAYGKKREEKVGYEDKRKEMTKRSSS